MDKLLAMQCFVRVVESGSFSKASDLMELPNSTVTRLIQGLEGELRVKLLQRSTRSLRMTLEGSAYYEGALAVLGQIEELDQQVSHAATTPKGKLKIELSAAVAYSIILPALPTFFALHPEIVLDIGVSNRSIDLISESVDCVVRVGPLLNDSLIARRLGTLRMVTCASPDYLDRHAPLAHPDELDAGHTVVQVVSPRTGRNFVASYAQGDARIEGRGRYRVSVNDSVAALCCVRAGLGVLTSYEFLMADDIRRGALRRVLADWSNGEIEVHAAYPMNRHLTRKVRAFVDWVGGVFAAKADLA